MINILNAHQKSKVEELLFLIKPLDSVLNAYYSCVINVGRVSGASTKYAHLPR